MKDLRDILRESLEEEVLVEYFKENYNNVTQGEKEELLELAKAGIERKLNMILSAFLDEIKKDDPNLKQKKIMRTVFVILSVIATAGLGYAVNKEYWVFVVICSAIILVAQVYQILSE